MVQARTRLERLRALRTRLDAEIEAEERLVALRTARPTPAPVLTASDKQIRAWARAHGLPVGLRGKLRADIREAYVEAHRRRP